MSGAGGTATYAERLRSVIATALGGSAPDARPASLERTAEANVDTQMPYAGGHAEWEICGPVECRDDEGVIELHMRAAVGSGIRTWAGDEAIAPQRHAGVRGVVVWRCVPGRQSEPERRSSISARTPTISIAPRATRISRDTTACSRRSSCRAKHMDRTPPRAHERRPVGSRPDALVHSVRDGLLHIRLRGAGREAWDGQAAPDSPVCRTRRRCRRWRCARPPARCC